MAQPHWWTLMNTDVPKDPSVFVRGPDSGPVSKNCRHLSWVDERDKHLHFALWRVGTHYPHTSWHWQSNESSLNCLTVANCASRGSRLWPAGSPCQPEIRLFPPLDARLQTPDICFDCSCVIKYWLKKINSFVCGLILKMIMMNNDIGLGLYCAFLPQS